MGNIQLFIENNEIELSKSVQFAITKQFEDITNPTVIINDWSKTVEIPFTDKNNLIFGNIFNVNRVITAEEPYTGADNVGIYFNPYLKLNMRLLYDGMLIMTGYAKMNTINKKDGNGTYNITLNGELGKVFQEMKKITFDENEYEGDDKEKYYIDGSKYYEEYINKDLVYDSWTKVSQSYESLEEKRTESGASNYKNVPSDFVGFAPCNAFHDDFDYNLYQLNAYESTSFADVLDERYKEIGKTDIKGSDLIPNGMLPREIGEFRSYLQTPFIFWNKLFKIFCKKAEEITGYSIELDGEWFNRYNTYWYNVIMMAKSFVGGDVQTYNNYYAMNIPSLQWSSRVSQGVSYIKYDELKTSSVSFVNSGSQEQYEGLYDFTNQRMIINKKNGNIINSLSIPTFTLRVSDGGWNNAFRFGTNNALEFRYKLTGSNGEIDYKKILICNESLIDESEYIRIHGVDFKKSDYFQIIGLPSEPTAHVSERWYDWTFTANQVNSYANYQRFGDWVKMSVEAIWVNDEPICVHVATPFRPGIVYITPSTGSYDTVTYNMFDFKSNSYFKLNNIWNNDVSLFDTILNYCKMFNLIITVDNNKKVVRFEHQNTFFSRYTIEDWTDKIDFGRNYTVKPITFENKYVLFNYDENNTKLGKTYKNKYGLEFGEQRIITEYNFNDETKKLFGTNIVAPMVNTDNILSWNNIYSGKIRYSLPAEVFVYSKDSDNKFIENFGAFYLWKGTSNFDTEGRLNLRNTFLSDDTDFQVSNYTYMYNQDVDIMTRVTTYPNIDIIDNGSMCTFSVPAECYTYNNDYSNSNAIYDSFWREYINERYNVQNKIVTCYAKISPIDYLNFDFNKFVRIDNQLYIVNKIYDYDISSSDTTKIDLITIQNINGYTKSIGMDKLNEHSEEIHSIDIQDKSKIYIGATEVSGIELTTFDTYFDTTFGNGQKTISYGDAGIEFEIVDNNTIKYSTSRYVDKPVIDINLVLTNGFDTKIVEVQRYSTYPYPEVSADFSSISTDRGDGHIYWTYTNSNNPPTVTITYSSTVYGTVEPIDYASCQVESVIWQEGEIEMFLNKWTIPVTWHHFHETTDDGETVTFTLQDEAGWHDSITIPIYVN